MNASFRKALAIVTIVALPFVSACSSSGKDPVTSIDGAIANQDTQTAIALSCVALQGAEAGWTAWTASHPTSGDNLKNAQAAIAGAAALCTPPYPQNTADAIAKVIQATVAVVTALKSETAVVAAN